MKYLKRDFVQCILREEKEKTGEIQDADIFNGNLFSCKERAYL